MRTRILCPGFFENDELARLPAMARLLFAGLWCLADRAGRLEDRPPRITARLFPYEDVDVEPLLETLAGAGFISRYAGPDGRRCLHVTKFLVYQRPHMREMPSTLPPPPDSGKTLSKNSEHRPRLCLGGAEDQPRHHLGNAQAQPRSPVSVSVSVPVQDQDQPAAPEFSFAAEREPDPQFKTYAAIYSAVLQDFALERKPDDPGACDEVFKARCAKQGLPYDADITRKAGDAARVARDKKAAELSQLFATRSVRSL